jgi:hypothetical protein
VRNGGGAWGKRGFGTPIRLLARGELLQFRQSAIANNLAPIDDDDTIRHRFHLLQDLGGQQHGFVVCQMADEMWDFENLMRIKA